MSAQYSTDPYEYWVIDDFLPPEMAWACYEHFHDDATSPWTRRHHLYCWSKYTRTVRLPQTVEDTLVMLEGQGMCHYIAQLANFPILESDKDRYGGGQHYIAPGGKLGIHADFTHHPKTGMRRAVNLLLYLNPNWRKEDGGELELWSADMKRCVRRIEPLHNRAVIFKTSVTSYHGHPEPCHAMRQSLAVYYYVQQEYEWITLADGDTQRRGPLKDYLRTTDYRPRPWEYGLRARRWLSRMVKG